MSVGYKFVFAHFAVVANDIFWRRKACLAILWYIKQPRRKKSLFAAAIAPLSYEDGPLSVVDAGENNQDEMTWLS